MAEVAVVSPLGSVGTVAEEELAAALEQGYAQATPEQYADAQLRAEYGGGGDAALAALSGVASGATLGLSDVAIAELGGRDTLRAYEQLHGGLRGTGQLGGALLGLGKFGGAGVASKGMRALSAPARAVEAAGSGVAAALEARGFGRAAQYAAGGLTEGLLSGAGDAVSRAAIDSELNGEKIAASMLGSAAAGGVLGYGLGRVGQAFDRSGKALARSVADPGAPALSAALAGASGIAPPASMTSRLGDAFAATSGFISGKDKSLIRKLTAQTDEARELRKLATEADGLTDEFVSATTKRLDDWYEHDARVSQWTKSGSLKKELLEQNVDATRHEDQFAAFAARTHEMSSALDEMIAAGGDDFKQAGLRKLRRQVEKAETAALAGEGATSAELMGLLDVDLKRELGRAVSKLKRGAGDASSYAAVDKLQPLYDGLRGTLEDVSLWGRAAEFQRAINAPLSESLATQRAFLGDFFAAGRGRHPIDPWLDRHAADPSKVRGYLTELGTPDLSLRHKALQNTLTERAHAYRALLQYGDVDDATRIAAKRSLELVDEQLAHTAHASRARVASEELKRIEPDSGTVAGLIGGAIGSGNLGALAVAPFLNPARTVRQMAAVERVAERLNGRITKGAREVVDGAARAHMPGRVALPRVAAALERERQQHGERRTRREEFSRRANRVRALMANRAASEASLRQALELVQTGAPRAHAAAIATTMRATDYLASHLPQDAIRPGAFRGEPVVTRAEAEKWLRRARAVENPTSVLDDLSAGRLSREGVDAVKTVYPELYREIQTRVLDEVVALDAEGKRPSYQRRIQLGTLLEIPTDPSLEPERLAALQALYVADERAEAQASRRSEGTAPAISAAFKTGSQALEST